MKEQYASGLANLAMLVGRFIIVFGLIPNGMRKLEHFAQTAAAMGGTPQIIDGRPFPGVEPLIMFPFPQFFLAFSVCFDIGGAILIILGLASRQVAVVLFCYCLLAMTIYHHDLANAENVMSLMRGLPLVGGLIYIAGAGAGGWSLDAWRHKARATVTLTESRSSA